MANRAELRLVTELAGASGPHPATGEFRQSFDLDDGWRAEVVLGEQDGRSIVTALMIYPRSAVGAFPLEQMGREVQQAAPTGGLTSSLLRALRLGDLADEARRERDFYSDVLVQVEEADGIAAQRMPGPKGRRDYHYALIADQYVRLVNAGHHRPLVALADAYSTPARAVGVRTAENWLREARARKLLTASDRPGKPGGRLTDLGRKALEDER